ncbi:phosphatidylinositol mannoside acyltransferase [Antribacter gilvus]|uniref:phosphatidylinositol mannoside acyltransferase n=1 Tax=Antribacter gilvus TaxID=2304675 RepID=UPI000F7A4324|nr:phosphatidylinositol mannoside acyltransferase [Antribacter gilvus]
MIDVAKAYTLAWRHAPKIPEPLLRAAFTVVADVTWWRRGSGVRRLEANYARVRPDLDARGVRALARAGMRSYMRYFREAFTLQGASPAQVDARVRLVGHDEVLGPLLDRPGARRGAAVLALAHLGNWDLAGAYCSRHIAPVLTVAEKLKPEALFHEFVAFRRSLGIEALGLGDGEVFRGLLAGVLGGDRLVPLLADRDLTATGVEVDLCGHRARVAAGPAALALAAKAPLVPTTITYERLSGERRRAARTPWGIVIQFHDPVTLPDPLPDGVRTRPEQVAHLSQAWVDVIARTLTERTEDWHMLQRVFVADLDPVRDQERRASAVHDGAAS